MTMETAESRNMQERPEDTIAAADTRQVYSPRSDVYETGDAVVVVSEMPGAKESDIAITLEKNVLILSGTAGDQTPEGYRRRYSEYTPGDFERRFALPQDVDRDSIDASVKNGLLTLTLPKAKEAQPRRIEVRSA